jgi:Squalene-hopene cyclase C-terminal domain/Prenyltransferase and squalene oxidase repeat
MVRTTLLLFAVFCAVGCERQPAPAAGAAPNGAPPAAASTRPEPDPPGAGDWKSEAKAAVDKGIRFLADHRNPQGRWGFNSKVPDDLGITALILLAAIESPRKYRESDAPWVRDNLDWIASSQKPDGSIHGGMLATYNTSVAILALVASENPKYRPVIDKAVEYLRLIQADEGEKYQTGDRYYGGIGYGGDERPDLSNTQFALEAARAGGAKPDDPIFKKGEKFLNRTQNRSESNDLPDKDVVPGNDGGGFYSPGVNPGEAKAGFVSLPDGRKIRRSYGSMSYCLLKSYLFCNIDVKDARVQALVDWLSKNYQLEYNPGMDDANKEKPEGRYSGLFYYYLSMARTLAVVKGDLLKDAAGKPRNWREELSKTIVKLQREDGSWANEKNKDFWEDSPYVATAMALNALNACLK